MFGGRLRQQSALSKNVQQALPKEIQKGAHAKGESCQFKSRQSGSGLRERVEKGEIKTQHAVDSISSKGHIRGEQSSVGRWAHSRFQEAESDFVGKAQLCQRCKNPPQAQHPAPNMRVLHVHHKDRDKTNNKLTNLEVLCQSCHSKEHWEEKVRGGFAS